MGIVQHLLILSRGNCQLEGTPSMMYWAVHHKNTEGRLDDGAQLYEDLLPFQIIGSGNTSGEPKPCMEKFTIDMWTKAHGMGEVD